MICGKTRSGGPNHVSPRCHCRATILPRKLPAGLGAGATGGGALLTVGMIVLGAFVGAFRAYLNTLFDEVPGVLGAAGHEAGDQGADVGAVPVETDAVGHVAHMLFAQAGGGAVLTGRHAVVERVEQGLVLGGGSGGVGHNGKELAERNTGACTCSGPAVGVYDSGRRGAPFSPGPG